MSKYSCSSASDLLVDIVGGCDDASFGLEEAAFDERSLHDLYELMWEEEKDNDSESKVRGSTSVPSIGSLLAQSLTSTSNANECSICFMPFDQVVAELDCGHKFCSACLEVYLQMTISTAPPLIHRRSFTRLDESSLSIWQRDLVGIPCPHYHCLGVIQEPKIAKLVDEGTYSKFDRFALDQALIMMRRKKELTPCPFNCGYFTQEDCLCVNIDCRKRQLYLRKREEDRLKKLMTSADERLEKWATANPELVKLCPLCYSQIEKNGGCDHMYCTRCQKPFLWSKALPFASTGHWLSQARSEVKRRRANPLPGVIFAPEEEIVQ